MPSESLFQQLPIHRWPYGKREAESRFMDIITTPVDGVLPTAKGEIPASTETDLRKLMQELGLTPPEIEIQLEDFKRGVPASCSLPRALVPIAR